MFGREHAPVIIEGGPVGVGPADHHTATVGEGIGDRAQIETGAPQVLSGSDREVLIVEKEGDAFFISGHHWSLADAARYAAVRGGVAQPAEARRLKRRSCGFKSHRPHCSGAQPPPVSSTS